MSVYQSTWIVCLCVFKSKSGGLHQYTVIEELSVTMIVITAIIVNL